LQKDPRVAWKLFNASSSKSTTITHSYLKSLEKNQRESYRSSSKSLVGTFWKVLLWVVGSLVFSLFIFFVLLFPIT
jgi:hypothetical protein